MILGAAANAGRDKITFFTSPAIYDMGAWFEQLIAESTGKLGKGITPVDLEEIAAPDHYGEDRIFAYVRLEGADNARLDAAVEKLEKAGQPVVRLAMRDVYDAAEQFFTWEIATAVAGSVMGINAFNQPDVEAAKIEARRLTTEYEKTGKLPEQTPIFDDGKIKLFADTQYAAVLHGAQGMGQPDLTGYLRAHLAQLKPGIISPRSVSFNATGSMRRPCKRCATRCETRNMSPLAWVLARAFCTPPGRTIKAAPIPECFANHRRPCK